MSTSNIITPTEPKTIATPLTETIETVTRQGARALRTKNQPQEWKIISLRECPTPEDMQLCDTPDRAASYWRTHILQNPYFDPERETFVVMILNTRRRIKGHYLVSIGTMDTILVHPREVFKLAILASASALVLAHNHPSGDPTPSDADIKVTRDLIRAGQLLRIEVLDHVVMLSKDLDKTITWWNNRNLWATNRQPEKLRVRFGENRFYEVMGGEDEREGGALLYFNLKQPLPITAAQREYPSPMQFLEQARQHTGVWVDIEKPFWWDVPTWLASGQADSIGLANNHMCRDQMYVSEAWGKPRDTQRLPPPRGNGLWTQEIYYHILNCGLRIPPSAGSASGVLPNPVGYNRVYVHLGKKLDYDNWWEGLRAGRSFVSNGPLLRCRANGKLPGSVFSARKGKEVNLEIKADLTTRDPISALEVVKNGRVEQRVSFEEWKKTGKVGKLKFNESGWFLVRAIADNTNTFRFASTAPFYVEIGDARRRVSRTSAQFFLDWVRERQQRVKLENPAQRAEVLAYHAKAEKFWEDLLSKANAD